jgi:hypothetical protein
MSDMQADLPTKLRDTAANIHSRGPGIATVHLRSAADALDAALKRAAEAEHSIRVALAMATDRDAAIAVLRDHLAAADELAIRRGKEVEDRDGAIATMEEMIRGRNVDISTRDATIAGLRELLEFKRQEIAALKTALAGYRARDLDAARDL